LFSALLVFVTGWGGVLTRPRRYVGPGGIFSGYSPHRPRSGTDPAHSPDGAPFLHPIFNAGPSGLWAGGGRGGECEKECPRSGPVSGAGNGAGAP